MRTPDERSFPVELDRLLADPAVWAVPPPEMLDDILTAIELADS